jgi:hypothetical protein
MAGWILRRVGTGTRDDVRSKVIGCSDIQNRDDVPNSNGERPQGYGVQSSNLQKGNKSQNTMARQVLKDNKPGGKLNPNFVEFLMGYPMNWTKIDQAE